MQRMDVGTSPNAKLNVKPLSVKTLGEIIKMYAGEVRDAIQREEWERVISFYNSIEKEFLDAMPAAKLQGINLSYYVWIFLYTAQAYRMIAYKAKKPMDCLDLAEKIYKKAKGIFDLHDFSTLGDGRKAVVEKEYLYARYGIDSIAYHRASIGLDMMLTRQPADLTGYINELEKIKNDYSYFIGIFEREYNESHFQEALHIESGFLKETKKWLKVTEDLLTVAQQNKPKMQDNDWIPLKKRFRSDFEVVPTTLTIAKQLAGDGGSAITILRSPTKEQESVAHVEPVKKEIEQIIIPPKALSSPNNEFTKLTM